jgi:hypothetical protein
MEEYLTGEAWARFFCKLDIVLEKLDASIIKMEGCHEPT